MIHFGDCAICIGPVCIPYQALYGLVFFLQPVWKWLLVSVRHPPPTHSSAAAPPLFSPRPPPAHTSPAEHEPLTHSDTPC